MGTSLLRQVALKTKPLFARIADLLFPPRCAACRLPVQESGGLCGECWQQMHFLSDPMCACCGHPFDYTVAEGALCGACMIRRPSYTRARAVFSYDEKSRPLVLRLKYQDQTHLASSYGHWLARVGAPLLAQAEAIVPVPLHRRRLFLRRYNQAALLAYALSRHCVLPVWPQALRRKRHTTPQAGLTRTRRQANVRGAFTVSAAQKPKLAGKRVLLIDDVMTTGATVEAAAKALLRGGAARVDVLTLARRV